MTFKEITAERIEKLSERFGLDIAFGKYSDIGEACPIVLLLYESRQPEEWTAIATEDEAEMADKLGIALSQLVCFVRGFDGLPMYDPDYPVNLEPEWYSAGRRLYLDLYRKGLLSEDTLARWLNGTR